MAEHWSGGAYTRIDTWKRIAAYLGADSETVQMWAQQKGLPIHRWPGGERGGAFAYTADLDRWMRDQLARAEAAGSRPGTSRSEVDFLGDRQITPLLVADTILPPIPDHIPSKVGHLPVAEKAPVLPKLSSDPRSASTDSRVWSGARGFLAAAAVVFVAVLATALLHSVEGGPIWGPSASMARDFSSSFTSPPSRTPSSSSPPNSLVTGGHSHRPSGDAMELYLQARYAWELRTPESLAFAKRDFSEAIQRDPDYAQAYAGLAECYLLMRQYAGMSSAEAFPAAERAARQAVSLDGSSSEAHRSLAFVLSYWKWDMAAAEREFHIAIALNPNDAEAHHWYATSLMNRGRFTEAQLEIDKARALEPSSRAIVANRGLILLLSGEREKGLAALRSEEASDPQFMMPHVYLADEYLRRGDDESFLAEEHVLSRLRDDRDLEVEVNVARKSLKAGGHSLMLRTLAERAASRADGGGNAYRAALYSMLSHNQQGALRYLKLSHDRHETMFLSIEDAEEFAPLRTNPEFRALSALADVHT